MKSFIKTDSFKPKTKIHFDNDISRRLYLTQPLPSSNFIESPGLKGRCHAILVKCQNTKRCLCINEENNAVYLLPITIEVH